MIGTGEISGIIRPGALSTSREKQFNVGLID
jgi:hypothetical protein